MAYQKLQAYRAASVTPSNTANIPSVGGGDGENNGCVLYIGDGGDLLVNTVGGNEKVLFSNVPIGFFPVQVTKVWKTVGAAKGAGKLVALW